MDKILIEDITFANKVLYEVQKQRIALGNRLSQKEKEGYLLDKAKKLYADMELIEKRTIDVIKEAVSYANLWDGFFKDIKGIGEVLTSSLIAEIKDIGKFRTISTLWAYAGLISEYDICRCKEGHKLMVSNASNHKTCPVLIDFDGTKCGAEVEVIEHITGQSPRRKRGYHYLFNNRLKTICWQISEQFIKQNPIYKVIYDKEKEKQANLYPELKKLHIHNRAKRKMVKIFLAHLWEAWRKLEGLEIRPPYVIEKLGHSGYLSLAELKALIKETKEEAKKIKVA